MLALGIVLWVLYGVLVIKQTTDENLEQTHCNQGLLVLATHGIRDEAKLAKCPPEIRRQLQGVK